MQRRTSYRHAQAASSHKSFLCLQASRKKGAANFGCPLLIESSICLERDFAHHLNDSRISRRRRERSIRRCRRLHCILNHSKYAAVQVGNWIREVDVIEDVVCICPDRQSEPFPKLKGLL